ncbi:MAG: 30S ribosomal protein S15 [DPANN group archaeon]|nr:30S ribosomal protein S15 [DPANN group archaeon]
MARMHSRKKGNAGSTKPVDKTVPIWVEYKADEVERLIIKLKKEDKDSALIGTILKDQYGIPSVKALTGNSISNIIEQNGLKRELPEDLRNLMVKAVNIKDHMENNKKDLRSKRGLNLVEAKIRRLGKYYTKTKVLAPKWVYNPKRAKIAIQ